ncbi:MAG TPA: ABC transporter ATP-binding protein [Pyrinomonadaceae bacterium]|nr:ABC transporter ATP-binding protein [Pyrinomonadaceae bacterium]
MESNQQMNDETIKPEFAVNVENISKKFGSATVLENVSFTVAEGETIVLLGASGSGKTTILRIIAGLETCDSGNIILHGKDVTNLPARERGIGVIFQNYALFPKMSVAENIGFGLKIRGKAKNETAEIVDELIKLVKLEEHRDKFPSQLSGGQQQRVAIARALAYKPEVLLFDEPFSALDAQIRARLRGEIRALLKQINVPSIFITHDQEEALELGDRIAVLNSAKIEQIGTPFDVYNKPETEYVATFLGAANLLLGVIHDGKFEIENTRLKLGIEADRFADGQSVKLVFRPEDVVLSELGIYPANTRYLINGIVEETSFVGAYERLSVRLEYKTRQPIIVTRPKPETTNFPLQIGQKVEVSLTDLRLIPNFALSSERAGKVF